MSPQMKCYPAVIAALSNSLIAEEIFKNCSDISDLANLIIATHSFIAVPRNNILNRFNSNRPIDQFILRIIQALSKLPRIAPIKTSLLLCLAAERLR